MYSSPPLGPSRQDIRLANLCLLFSVICLIDGVLIVGFGRWHWEKPPLWGLAILYYLLVIIPIFSIFGSMLLAFQYSTQHPAITYRGVIAMITAFIGLGLPGLSNYLFR